MLALLLVLHVSYLRVVCYLVSHISKVCFVPVFANQNKSEEDFRFYENSQKVKKLLTVCLQFLPDFGERNSANIMSTFK